MNSEQAFQNIHNICTKNDNKMTFQEAAILKASFEVVAKDVMELKKLKEDALKEVMEPIKES